MSRPHRRMLTLPSAEALTVGPNALRLRKKKDRLLFMTYNLLAQALVRRDMFPHSSQKALKWKFRKQNILQEFLSYGPDLACLQEVDFWEEVYLPSLIKAGYDTAYYKNANKKHGCAIIWRKTRFEKENQLTLEYDDIGQPTFTTGNVGLMVALKPLTQKIHENPDPNADMILPEENETQQNEDDHAGQAEKVPGGLLVATTHLFWRPDGSYERLRQASIFVEKIQEWNKNLNYTVLIGGDFNTTPRDAAYRAMTRSQMPPHQIPNLEKWLIDEVARVQEAQAPAASDESKDSIDELTAKTGNLDLSTNKGKETPSSDLPYRAPPTGIILPKKSASSTPSPPAEKNGGDSPSPPSTIVNAAEFATSEDPKIKNLAAQDFKATAEDAPVYAPLEAFTPPKDLLASIESRPRCISIYSQYETLIKNSPGEKCDPAILAAAAAAEAAAVAKGTAEESTASPAPTQHMHGEPAFTNFANWFKDTLDYVYLLDEPLKADGARLVPLKLLEIPDASFLGHGLPDENFSSDHLCLLVEFAILAQ
ncbi:RNA exonuclease NGL2 [Entomortierella parvispora]|uniref:RNA exonuclease NGL2 n=1 Tax=Entomortierella parvispora TaxID=205924 RepID=A0A9P3HB73_9FUNG|nr:RNA exonuclease NGL2 [Entomortierella parvispora]